jgi:hypothetical protein
MKIAAPGSSGRARRTLAGMTQWGIEAIFNPATRHVEEEKRRLQATREEVGDASGGRRIDFETGKVTIRVPKKSEAEPDDSETEA